MVEKTTNPMPSACRLISVPAEEAIWDVVMVRPCKFQPGSAETTTLWFHRQSRLGMV
jgi:hypothetical protein